MDGATSEGTIQCPFCREEGIWYQFDCPCCFGTNDGDGQYHWNDRFTIVEAIISQYLVIDFKELPSWCLSYLAPELPDWLPLDDPCEDDPGAVTDLILCCTT